MRDRMVIFDRETNCNSQFSFLGCRTQTARMASRGGIVTVHFVPCVVCPTLCGVVAGSAAIECTRLWCGLPPATSPPRTTRLVWWLER